MSFEETRPPNLAEYPFIVDADFDPNVFQEEGFSRIVAERGISAEGQRVIGALATLDSEDVIFRYHNFFSPYSRSGDGKSLAEAALQAQLDGNSRRLRSAEEAGKTTEANKYREAALLDSGFIYLTRNYGPSVTKAISRLLEDRQPADTK